MTGVTTVTTVAVLAVVTAVVHPLRYLRWRPEPPASAPEAAARRPPTPTLVTDAMAAAPDGTA
jgi:hypothetical protein